ncbi:SCO family protein [Phycisphaerales bacterium AB-hyl4]|uniref:SCO family protein n=1 Tax=Natronomicrosphaera hydrolytica TaxID=3242702 RepID=A0ABV4UAM2_9BACT
MAKKTNEFRNTLLFFAGAAVGAVVLAGLLASVTVMMRGTPTASEREPVPVLYGVPSFELTSQAEQAVRRDDLRGKVWVANFIFTRCASVCPMVTGRTAELQQMLRTHERWSDMRLISFTVDPGHDTPEVLRDYGQRFGADPEQWLFLTGERDYVWQLIEQGFRLPVEDAPDNPEMPILHSDKFVLVDRDGQIRGYYSALDQAERAQLLVDLHTVVSEPWSSDGDAGSRAAAGAARR